MGRTGELWEELSRHASPEPDLRADYYAAQLGSAAAELSAGEIRDILRGLRETDPHTYAAILAAALAESGE